MLLCGLCSKILYFQVLNNMIFNRKLCFLFWGIFSVSGEIVGTNLMTVLLLEAAQS